MSNKRPTVGITHEWDDESPDGMCWLTVSLDKPGYNLRAEYIDWAIRAADHEVGRDLHGSVQVSQGEGTFAMFFSGLNPDEPERISRLMRANPPVGIPAK